MCPYKLDFQIAWIFCVVSIPFSQKIATLHHQPYSMNPISKTELLLLFIFSHRRKISSLDLNYCKFNQRAQNDARIRTQWVIRFRELFHDRIKLISNVTQWLRIMLQLFCHRIQRLQIHKQLVHSTIFRWRLRRIDGTRIHLRQELSYFYVSP